MIKQTSKRFVKIYYECLIFIDKMRHFDKQNMFFCSNCLFILNLD